MDVGRLRPDFLARCQWDQLLNQCTGYDNDAIESNYDLAITQQSERHRGWEAVISIGPFVDYLLRNGIPLPFPLSSICSVELQHAIDRDLSLAHPISLGQDYNYSSSSLIRDGEQMQIWKELQYH